MPSTTASTVIRRRNAQAAKIAKLEDQLWQARAKLKSLDAAVFDTQSKENLTLRYGNDDQWSWSA